MTQFLLKPLQVAILPGMSGPVELAILALIVLLLFGNRLPGAMKSLGQSFVAFKSGIKDGENEAASDAPQARDEESSRSQEPVA